MTQHRSQSPKMEPVRVFVRVRGLNEYEKKNVRFPGGKSWTVVSPASISQPTNEIGVSLARKEGKTFFTFNRVFDENVSTRDVYDETSKNLIKNFVNGISGNIIAFGQTSAGKTFTMQGRDSIKNGSSTGNSKANGGIIQMAAMDIFSELAKHPNDLFLLRVSAIEVYNEEIRDLLSPDITDVPTRYDPDLGLFVDATEDFPMNYHDLIETLSRADKKRNVRSTGMNERSSRSHTMFRIVLEKKKIDDQTESIDLIETEEDGEPIQISTLNLIDLAGSDTILRFQRLDDATTREGKQINKSLFSLSRVFEDLSKTPKVAHVNYRDSNLTRILQPYLTGNLKFVIICCITPSTLYAEQTRKTLEFGTFAKGVSTRTTVTRVLDDRSFIIKTLREVSSARSMAAIYGDIYDDRLKDAEEKWNKIESSVIMGGTVYMGTSFPSERVIEEKTDSEEKTDTSQSTMSTKSEQDADSSMSVVSDDSLSKFERDVLSLQDFDDEVDLTSHNSAEEEDENIEKHEKDLKNGVSAASGQAALDRELNENGLNPDASLHQDQGDQKLVLKLNENGLNPDVSSRQDQDDKNQVPEEILTIDHLSDEISDKSTSVESKLAPMNEQGDDCMNDEEEKEATLLPDEEKSENLSHKSADRGRVGKDADETGNHEEEINLMQHRITPIELSPSIEAVSTCSTDEDELLVGPQSEYMIKEELKGNNKALADARVWSEFIQQEEQARKNCSDIRVNHQENNDRTFTGEKDGTDSVSYYSARSIGAVSTCSTEDDGVLGGLPEDVTSSQNNLEHSNSMLSKNEISSDAMEANRLSEERGDEKIESMSQTDIVAACEDMLNDEDDNVSFVLSYDYSADSDTDEGEKAIEEEIACEKQKHQNGKGKVISLENLEMPWFDQNDENIKRDAEIPESASGRSASPTFSEGSESRAITPFATLRTTASNTSSEGSESRAMNSFMGCNISPSSSDSESQDKISSSRSNIDLSVQDETFGEIDADRDTSMTPFSDCNVSPSSSDSGSTSFSFSTQNEDEGPSALETTTNDNGTHGIEVLEGKLKELSFENGLLMNQLQRVYDNSEGYRKSDDDVTTKKAIEALESENTLLRKQLTDTTVQLKLLADTVAQLPAVASPFHQIGKQNKAIQRVDYVVLPSGNERGSILKRQDSGKEYPREDLDSASIEKNEDELGSSDDADSNLSHRNVVEKAVKFTLPQVESSIPFDEPLPKVDSSGESLPITKSKEGLRPTKMTDFAEKSPINQDRGISLEQCESNDAGSKSQDQEELIDNLDRDNGDALFRSEQESGEEEALQIDPEEHEARSKSQGEEVSIEVLDEISTNEQESGIEEASQIDPEREFEKEEHGEKYTRNEDEEESVSDSLDENDKKEKLPPHVGSTNIESISEGKESETDVEMIISQCEEGDHEMNSFNEEVSVSDSLGENDEVEHLGSGEAAENIINEKESVNDEETLLPQSKEGGPEPKTCAEKDLDSDSLDENKKKENVDILLPHGENIIAKSEPGIDTQEVPPQCRGRNLEIDTFNQEISVSDSTEVTTFQEDATEENESQAKVLTQCREQELDSSNVKLSVKHFKEENSEKESINTKASNENEDMPGKMKTGEEMLQQHADEKRLKCTKNHEEILRSWENISQTFRNYRQCLNSADTEM